MNHSHTSEHRVYDLRRPDRRTPMKVLVEKKFEFVEPVWSAYVAHNKPDIMFTHFKAATLHVLFGLQTH